MRDFVHVDDVAAANVAAAQLIRRLDRSGFAAFNVCSGRPISILEVASRAVRCTRWHAVAGHHRAIPQRRRAPHRRRSRPGGRGVGVPRGRRSAGRACANSRSRRCGNSLLHGVLRRPVDLGLRDCGNWICRVAESSPRKMRGEPEPAAAGRWQVRSLAARPGYGSSPRPRAGPGGRAAAAGVAGAALFASQPSTAELTGDDGGGNDAEGQPAQHHIEDAGDLLGEIVSVDRVGPPAAFGGSWNRGASTTPTTTRAMLRVTSSPHSDEISLAEAESLARLIRSQIARTAVARSNAASVMVS